MTSRRDNNRLTIKQANVLFIVTQHEPITASDVAQHLRMDDARGILGRLEKRALIDAQYSGTFRSARCYVGTERGREALAAADFQPEDDEEEEVT